MSLAFHVTIRLVDSRVLASGADLCVARRCVAGRGLLAWVLADTHGHLLVVGDRSHAGEQARRVQLSLRRALGLKVGFDPARVRPVADQSHLRNAFWYLLRQDAHHGTQHDPWHVASCIPDLIGARVGDADALARVQRVLPRVSLRAVRQAAGWRPIPRVFGAADITAIAPAAAAAVGSPDLRSNRPEVRRARTAAAQLATAWVGPTRAARALGLGASTVRRLNAQPLHVPTDAALRAQLHWRALRPQPTETAQISARQRV